MNASFVYNPHVHRRDGSVVTPDLLVDRAYALNVDSDGAVPVGLLTSATAIQRIDDNAGVHGAFVLVGATYGTLAAPGLICGDTPIIGRQAWRLEDVRDSWAEGVLQINADAADGSHAEDIPLSSLPSSEEALGRLGCQQSLATGAAVFVTGSRTGYEWATGLEVAIKLPMAFQVSLRVAIQRL